MENQKRSNNNNGRYKRKYFLSELKEDNFRLVGVEVLITQIYETVQYFCKNCEKYSEKICDCGAFPEPAFRVTGIITDGTKTIPFKTRNDIASEKLTGEKKESCEKIDPKKMMNKVHMFVGGLRKGRFFVEDVILL